jgi:hypothetical protein
MKCLPSCTALFPGNAISTSKMILRRQGGGEDAYSSYVEEADDAANKDSALIWNWHNI